MTTVLGERGILYHSFARVVGHELRNRVNAARLSFSVVRLTDGERRVEAMQALDESLRQLEDAVAEVSSIAVAQARVLPAGARPAPLRELLAQLRDDLDALALTRRIEMRLVEPVPDTAVDGAKLRLALINLIASAAHHADLAKAERWVAIRVAAGEERGEWRIDVEDNGLGLAVLEQAAGASVEGERTAPVPRPELSMRLAQEAVARLGGRLWVESNTPGQGTTVAFTLRGAG